MNDTRKTEIIALLKVIEDANTAYRIKRNEVKELTTSALNGWLPKTSILKLESFEDENYFHEGDGNKFAFTFRCPTATFYISVQNRAVIYYSVSGISDRGESVKEDINNVTAYYNDVSNLLDFFQNVDQLAALDGLYAVLPKVEYSTFSTGMNESKLKDELRALEEQERIEGLNLTVGGVYEYYVESKRRWQKSNWRMVKVTKLTPKRMDIAFWHINEKRWLDGAYEVQTVPIKYNNLRGLTAEQLKLIGDAK